MTASNRRPLHVTAWGDRGAPVVMVHGSFTWGEDAWAEQRVLADHFRLLVLDRCGHGQSPNTGRFGFDDQAADIADFLGKSAHLVGSSFGAVLALIVAQREPGRIRSLTVIEPPAWGVARGDPAVEEQLAGFSLTPAEAARLGPDLAFSKFLEGIGAEAEESALTEMDRKNAAASFQETPLLEAPVSLESLSATKLPLLVVSGGLQAATQRYRNRRLAFHRVCQALAAVTGAEWAQFPGAGHNPHLEDPGFNRRLRAFLLGAEVGKRPMLARELP
jgi:pimeloyl-ACP methyl ester carboxylesterase